MTDQDKIARLQKALREIIVLANLHQRWPIDAEQADKDYMGIAIAALNEVGMS